jgi:hypothetical protein
VLQPGRRELPACLGPWCDPEGGESGKEPLHANPYARLTQMAMKAYSLLAQPERPGGEMNTVVVLQGN